MKSFDLKCFVHSDTIKTAVTGNKLSLMFKVDSKCACNVRVSTCVTEEKNEMNVPTMFYTPNREDYVANVNLMEGMK